MYQNVKTAGDSPSPSSARALPAPGMRCCSQQAGRAVTLHERSDAAMTGSTSHWAGGMLAPWCEAEAAEPVISRARHPLARSVAASISRKPRSTARWWWRIRATAPISSALPSSPPAIGGSTRRALRDARAVARRPLPRRPVLSRRGPCRAAPRAAASCMRASQAAGGAITFGSDADGRTISTAS